jgi:hypothetical protein
MRRNITLLLLVLAAMGLIGYFMVRRTSPQGRSSGEQALTSYHLAAIAEEERSPSASLRGGALQSFLDASRTYAEMPRRAYTPHFNLEALTPARHARGTQWFYIRDGNERIGLIQTWTKEIEMFRFFPEGDGTGPRLEIPEIYHWANLMGARIQMYGTQMLPPLTGFTLSFTKDRGDSLALKIENRHEGGILGTSEYRLTWDERLGYMWNCVSHYSLPKPLKVEFNNLLAGGVSESREDHKRWQKTVRAIADGRIVFVHHNPLNIPADNIQAHGFVGYVTEETMNPFVELIAASGPVSMVTCSQWYDQHIILNPHATGNTPPLSHAWARYRFLSLPGSLARELEAAAVPSNSARHSGGPGFLLNRTNDFEQMVTSEGVYNGGLWQHVTRDDKHAHSGRYSLKVAGRDSRKEVSIAPIGGGPGVVGESKNRYRLTAFVKTDLVKGTAYLSVDDVFWNWEDVKATRTSGQLGGRSEWTPLTVEFQPSANDPFLVVRLCVDGQGVAWFDDVMLEEVKSL